MKIILPLIGVTLPLLAAGSVLAAGLSVPAATAAKPAQLWGQVMTSLYGPYDKKRKCWIGTSDDGQMCMRPHKLATQNVDGVDRMFLVMAGKGVAGEDCHACTGSVGFAVLDRVGDNFVQSAISDLYLELGGWGDPPGEEAFSVRQLGPKEYGWVIESGYTGQGYTFGGADIFAPDAGKVKELGMVSTYFSDCGARADGEACEEHDYDISFDTAGAGRYFDIVLLPSPDAKKPAKVDRFVVPFDAGTGQYAEPAELKKLLMAE